MPTKFPVCINCCMYCTSQGPSRWLVRSPAPLSALQQQDPEMVCWHCFPAAQRKILWIPPGVTLCWGRSSHCWIDACSVLVYTCCNPSHVLFDLMHLGASLIWLNVIIHYLQVRNVFAKLITLLCYLTNKDPPLIWRWKWPLIIWQRLVCSLFSAAHPLIELGPRFYQS